VLLFYLSSPLQTIYLLMHSFVYCHSYHHYYLPFPDIPFITTPVTNLNPCCTAHLLAGPAAFNVSLATFPPTSATTSNDLDAAAPTGPVDMLYITLAYIGGLDSISLRFLSASFNHHSIAPPVNGSDGGEGEGPDSEEEDTPFSFSSSRSDLRRSLCVVDDDDDKEEVIPCSNATDESVSSSPSLSNRRRCLNK